MAKLLRRRFRRVLVDVDTQYDLVCQDNQDHSDLLRNIRRLIAWSRVHHIPVISTALTHRPVSCPEVLSDTGVFCLEGSPGQKKIRYTILTSNVLFGPDNRMDLPRHLLSDYQQIIFEKRSEDPFLMPRADRLLSELRADEFIVFGIGLENAIKHTVLGLLHRGKRVQLVLDAVDRDNNNTEVALRKLEAKGARLVKTASIAGHSRLCGRINHRSPWHASMLINARIG